MDDALKFVLHGQCDTSPSLRHRAHRWTMFVSQVQCDARLTVTFPSIRHHHPLFCISLYCLMKEARVCEQLAQDSCGTAKWLGIEPS